VLRANGALGGYRWGVERKRAMLAWELSQTVAAGA
jgi:O6-methylguanine-DNA--protein-cysteine methyltransferase